MMNQQLIPCQPKLFHLIPLYVLDYVRTAALQDSR